MKQHIQDGFAIIGNAILWLIIIGVVFAFITSIGGPSCVDGYEYVDMGKKGIDLVAC